MEFKTISAQQAKHTSQENVPFFKKMEIFNEVMNKIEAASLKGERKVFLTEEENLAVGNELKELGYKNNEGLFVIAEGFVQFTAQASAPIGQYAYTW